MATVDDDRLLRDTDDLIAPFVEAEKPRGRWRIGLEAEKFGLDAVGRPLDWHALSAVLDDLVRAHGWSPENEYPGGPTIALRRGAASVTLEPGGQLELSGAPHSSVHEAAAELETHLAELRSVCAPRGIRWLSLGFHPTARRDELPWVPKLRYGVMRAYLPTRGRRALDMMQRTCTVQVNLDYADEHDAMRKLRIGLALGPIVTGILAHSPFVEGAVAGRLDERAAVWLETDPDRTGLLPALWRDGAGYDDYVQWALDVPMFLVRRGATVVRNTGQRFRDFLRDGFGGARATRADWDAHLNSLFPEARLKRTLELRGADAQPLQTTAAVAALWKGLLYDEQGLAAAERLASRLAPDELEAARPHIAQHGPRAMLCGRPVAEWGNELLAIADAALARQGVLDAEGRDERRYLGPLRALLERGRCPADVLLDAARRGGRGVLDGLAETTVA
ncbi:MAG: glutamate-cysteine ligase family protein [Myxococcota bacterium]|nr:glutamate-cysteine ligase family protein [Myxococcota bacterium]MDW8360920.1 glutamate-cysteine ligase family protein [Myxococcales bacterium]